jgi:eukaryotic-like serine/threonine-protein kinase
VSDKSITTTHEKGFVLARRYRLDEVIASGGMAEVWQAQDLVLQRAVAVKLLHPHLAGDQLVTERFRREAIAAARLSHPNIVPTFDAGTDDGLTFIVMGLVNGKSLAEVLSQRKMTVAEAAMVGRQVADALDHAHNKALIHRDVKPPNVLLMENHRVMVTDFGIAKAVEEEADVSLTLPGLVIGTPAYSAPEQLAGEDVDERVDIYALGALLHEMVCRHISGEDAQPTRFSDPSTSDAEAVVCPDIPKELVAVIAKATAVDPNGRHQKVSELRDELAKIERGPNQRMFSPPPIEVSNPNDTGQIAVSSPPTEMFKAKKPAPALAPQPEPQQSRPAPQSLATKGEAQRVKAVAIFLTLLFLLAVVVGLSWRGLSTENTSEDESLPAEPIASVQADAFDPFGNNQTEHNEDAPLAVDGDPTTAWSTETYQQQDMGKPGVGLILELGESNTLDSMSVESSSQGWSASIYVSSGRPTTFEDWGEPVDVQSGLGSQASFDLHQAEGDSVMLWITDVGNAGSFSATEVQIEAS